MLETLRAPASRYQTPNPPDLNHAAERRRLSPAAYRAMVGLAGAWKLSVDEVGALLGGVAPSTWHSWKASPPADLGVDRLTRISYLIGIFTALHVLHHDALADEWVRLANTNVLFNGRAPLEVMAMGGIPMMAEVRTLLDSRRGGQ